MTPVLVARLSQLLVPRAVIDLVHTHDDHFVVVQILAPSDEAVGVVAAEGTSFDVAVEHGRRRCVVLPFAKDVGEARIDDADEDWREQIPEEVEVDVVDNYHLHIDTVA